MPFWKIYERIPIYDNGHKIKEEYIEIIQGNEEEIKRYISIKYPNQGYLYKLLIIPEITTESNDNLQQLKYEMQDKEKEYQRLRIELFGEHCC